MVLKMPTPKSGGLLISYWCNAKCRHCYLQCSQTKHEKMDIKDAHTHLREFHSVGIPEEEVHITGGEPFGNFNYLLEILKSANSTGYSGFGFVETNAFWAVNDKICGERLRTVKDLGTKKICISVDIFHQEFVSLENITRLIGHSHQILGSDSVILRWPNGLKQEKHIGQMTSKEIKEYLLSPARDFRVRLVGRAANSLQDYMPKKSSKQFSSSPCFDKMVGMGHYHLTTQDTVSFS